MAESDGAMRFNLFARFASSELTHSGVWGWILQSLDDDVPSAMHELRPAARALLARVGITSFESPVIVVRERRLPGVAGRVDVEATDREGRVVVLETKVHARPDIAQRQRYEDSYRAEGHRLAAVAIVSTTHDEPWGDLGPRYVGAEALLDVLRAGGPFQGDLIRQYVAWLENLIGTRRAMLERALGPDPQAASEALESAAAQWAVLRRLGEAIGGPRMARLYCGQNMDGSPWTQLAFSPGSPGETRAPEGSPVCDALFYRLESWAGVPAQLTLRQYRKPADREKPERLHRLRALFREAAKGSSLPFDTEPRGARKGAIEAKIAQITVPPATMASVLVELPAIHARFIDALRTTGWPLGPEPFAFLGDPSPGETPQGLDSSANR